MTRNGPSKPSDARHGANRLVIARGLLEAAQLQVDSAKVGTMGNPIAATVVNAAIAYTDALTATFANKINQNDHAAVVKTLRDALGNRLPKAQETRLTRILGNKTLPNTAGASCCSPMRKLSWSNSKSMHSGSRARWHAAEHLPADLTVRQIAVVRATIHNTGFGTRSRFLRRNDAY